MKKSKIVIIIGLAILLLIFIFTIKSGESDNGIQVEVKEGKFVISITTNGELDSKNSTVIKGPSSVRSLGIYQNLKLNNIIDEGTLVDSGDYIATIDQTPVLTKMKEVDANIEKFSSKISQSKLDSALILRADRDNLLNLRFNIHELEVELANSKYESPVTKDKIRINLEKAKRTLTQAENNYQLKKEKQDNIVRTTIIDYNKELDKKSRFMDVLKDFNIVAPQAGMLIYAKTWSGKKIKSGSEISPWNPKVAQLPDLSQMIVKTYVNEVDISKVKEGQKVEIGVDAFVDKKLEGLVKLVANIGEELQNTSAHVFEVTINVEGEDSDLRPAMTTKNVIIIDVIDTALFIPIECIYNMDTISYVYSDGEKVQVEAGQSNQDEIIIVNGLEKGQGVYLIPPDGAEDWDLKSL
jgi:multidrug resistance efflux pump